jgi:thymidylate synthase ThyX
MKVFVIDDQHPEDIAMMQALYSRSAASVTKHLEKVKKTGSGKFMESFYVGYGHESIGDCGSTTIFIEGVSILAAKEIQNWVMYSGQETSTRYIDMSKQSVTDPIGTEESKKILDDWIDFYHTSQEQLAEHLRGKYPIGQGETLTTYNKAIAARCFDILRAFLPAAINTQLAWHTNLRQAAHKLALLSHHPDKIIRAIGVEILEKLKEKYPNSFSHKKYEATEQYREMVASKYSYFQKSDRDIPEEFFDGLEQCLKQEMGCFTTIKPNDLEPYGDIITSRPIKAELPHFLMDLGLVNFKFLLDYGSWRDLQRHRNGVCRVPLLTVKHGFHPWYIHQLPETLAKRAEELIYRQMRAISTLECDEITRQYYVALGFQVLCNVSYGLPATVYTIELRSGNTVHPTLREAAIQMGLELKKKLPSLVLHMDESRDEWSVRRGTQDIIEK